MKLPTPQSPRQGERGSAVIETVIGVPAFMLFVALIITAGRIQMARQSVDAAAVEAARAASISRTAAEAQSRASASGNQALTNQSLRCTSTSVSIDTSGYSVPVGTPASVSATIVCILDVSDVAIPGLPGSLTITRSANSPLDTYRGR